MVKKIKCESKHLDFNDVEFGDIFPNRIFFPEAVKFVSEQGGILPSVYEVAVYRIKSDFKYDSRILTRNYIVYFEVKKKLYGAIGDCVTPEKNLTHIYSQLGHDSFRKFLLPYNDDVRSAILRSGEEGRIVKVSSWACYDLSMNDNKYCKSKFSEDDVIRACFFNVAELYSQKLSGTQSLGFVHILNSRALKELGVDDDHVAVHPVILDGVDTSGIYGDGGMGNILLANTYYATGWARPVRGSKDYSGEKIVDLGKKFYSDLENKLK